MLKKWVTSLKIATGMAKEINKPITQVHFTLNDIMHIDSGFTYVLETPETTIILTSEKSTIDTPKE